MEHYIFPAVFYRDEENDNYIVAFDDVQVYCMGKTIEEAFFTARKYLRDYCRLSIKMYGEVQEKPRTYLESCSIHKNEIVLLVDAEVKLSKKEEE
ncbi:MAG: hypothetical protein IJD48_00835 [Clostridia bacterium]|nr:hypothetical protein [Clostridia bacterium]